MTSSSTRVSASAIRKIANMTGVGDGRFLFDSGNKYNPVELKAALNDPERTPSPKASALVRKIQETDKDNPILKYKHVILTPDPEAAKFFASVLDANGYTIWRGGAMKESVLYLAPTSESRQSVLDQFNSSANDHGGLLRFLVADTATFLQKVNRLDNVKYMHIMEPLRSKRVMQQIVGLATRACAHAGIEYNTSRGWTLQVFVYDIEIPAELVKEFGNFGRLSEVASNYDEIGKEDVDRVFLNQFREATELGAFDYDLNKTMYAKRPWNAVVNSYGGGSSGGPKLGSSSHRKRLATTTTKRGGGVWDYLKSWIPGRTPGPAAPGLPGQRLIPGAGGRFGAASGMMPGTPPPPPPGNTNNTMSQDQRQQQQQQRQRTGMGAEPHGIMIRTREMLRQYFNPKNTRNGQRGLVLWHSEGTDKTCTAVAIGSQFVKDGYDVLWAGNTTPQQIDRALNDKLCSSFGNESERESTKQRYWRHALKPMSHEGLLDVLNGRNRKLVAELESSLLNRKTPNHLFEKVLLIIDHADQIVGKQVYQALHTHLDNAWNLKTPNVKYPAILLITSDDFVFSNPLNLNALVNLCKPKNQALKTEELGKLHNARGHFTNEGRELYLNHIASHVSRVDRSYDPSIAPIAELMPVVLAPLSDTKVGTQSRAKKIGQAMRVLAEKVRVEMKMHDTVIGKLRDALTSAKNARLRSEMNKAIDTERSIHESISKAYNEAGEKLKKIKTVVETAAGSNTSQRAALSKIYGRPNKLNFNNTNNTTAAASAATTASWASAAQQQQQQQQQGKPNIFQRIFGLGSKKS